MSDEWKTLARHVGLLVLSIAMIVPFLWMGGTSLKPASELDAFTLIPNAPQPANYAIVLRALPDPYTRKLLELEYPRWFANSVFVAAWVSVLQVLTSALAAYSFSRIEWRGRDAVFLAYLGTMMVPGLVLMLPNYQVMVKLGWVNSYWGLIIPSAFSAFGTFLLRQFMLSIPRSYDEAAEIDGAGHLRVFLDVILPLSRPGLVTLAILTFFGNFQSFFWPLVMVKDDRLRTLPVGLLNFQNQYGAQTELLMAAVVMTVVPLALVFFVMQKQIVAGLQAGGVKG